MNVDTPPIEIDPKDWLIVHNILLKHVPDRAVWVFGSRAKQTAKPYSDLDLCIVSNEKLPLSTLSALKEDFTESDLPWKVDVVDWKAIDEAFQEIILKDKVVAR